MYICFSAEPGQNVYGVDNYQAGQKGWQNTLPFPH